MRTLQDARVLVTGATGFVGAHLVRRLAAEGARVSALHVEDSATLRRHPVLGGVAGIDWHPVDLRTYGAVANAIRSIRPDAVFHLAAAGVNDPFLPPDAAIRTNLYGTLHLLRAVGGRATVVVTRTPGERDALNVYAASKASAWQFCRMYRRTQGWPIPGAMLFQVYGPGQPLKALVPSAIAAALGDRDFPMTHGAQQRDWVYVGDVVDAIVRLALEPDAGDETIEIGTGQTHTVREVVDSIYQMVSGSGKPLTGVLPARPGEVLRQVADVSRAKALIGWQARVSLEDGLRETITWMREWSSKLAG